jgi:hypothetical protein
VFLCLRVDLDYVPWDTPDADEFGHGEPAMIIRLLEFARKNGTKFHFFASSRVLRAFPASAEAVLNEGHHLDWLCKHPLEPLRHVEASDLFEKINHQPLGLATKNEWPNEAIWPSDELKFLCSPGAYTEQNIRHFEMDIEELRSGTKAGGGFIGWAENVKMTLRDHAARSMESTVIIRPQVLAKVDPNLIVLNEIIRIGLGYGLAMKTMRDALQSDAL